MNTHPLGAHMSISGGLDKAISRGKSVNCQTIQIFTQNSNRWVGKALSDEIVRACFDKRKETGIKQVFAHNSYLINLASPDAELRKKSLDAMIGEIRRCQILDIRGLVIHPGAHTGSGEKQGIITIIEQLKEILRQTTDSNVDILLETTAGQGTSIGHRFEHLAQIMETLGNRIKICVDTCHIFAAGYDIATEEGYFDTFTQFEKLIEIEKIALFHLNDSKKDLGIRVDRHEQIGKGKIGKTAFNLLMNDKRFTSIPKILETPKGKELEEDRVNLALLRGMIRL